MLIEEFEGWSSCPYWDGFGRVWTQGFGVTGDGIGPHTPCETIAEGTAQLAGLMARDYEPYIAALRIPLTQNEWDALCSFVYNLGPGVLGESHDVGRLLRARDYGSAANAMLEYDHAGGVVLQGLINRRRAERALFLTPDPLPPPHIDPYAVYPNVPIRLFGTVLRERDTVRSYDRAIKHPRSHEKQLAVLGSELVLLRKRVWKLAHYNPHLKQTIKPPRWGLDRLGARWQGLERRTR